MIKTVDYEGHYSKDDLELRLRDSENRNGRIVDVNGLSPQDPRPTVSTHNILLDPEGALHLVRPGTDEVPDGGTLDIAGTAFIENQKVAVAVYRTAETAGGAESSSAEQPDVSDQQSDPEAEPQEEVPEIPSQSDNDDQDEPSNPPSG